MNGTSGFREVRSSIPRSSTNRLLREQRHRFGTSAWHRFRTHDRSALSKDISAKREKFPGTISVSPTKQAAAQLERQSI